ncbi:MAG: EFR1 family ferrodoxin [Peptoniphilus sp.]|nr:EFR1 family ferrodoxin [Peptoniphilus sp.]MDY3119065.1 EFR1 family ferrodoxin [Peptoniphilus sp.]
MIYYYSGTGNSAYVAKILSEHLHMTAVDLGERIKAGNMASIDDGVIVLVTPTYGWRMPRFLEDYWKQIRVRGKKLYGVMTCGSEIGGAPLCVEKLAREKDLIYGGTFSVVMPENYIALFQVPAAEEARKILDRADESLESIARRIAAGEDGKKTASLAGRIFTGINGAFYALFVHARKFYAREECIGCGECERRCVLGNVKLEEGRPVWYDRCTHCMACINYCPVEAIEYGKKTVGRFRYTCEKVRKKNVSSREA